MALFLAPKAFLIGAWQALTSFRLLALLYLVNLLLAVPAAASIYRLLASTLAETRAAGMLLQQHDPEFVADFLRENALTLESVSSAVGVTAVLAFVLHVFLLGGIVTSLAEPTRPRSLMTFFSASGRCFFPFMRIWIPAGVALAALFVLNQFGSTLLVHYFDHIQDRGASAEMLAYVLVGKTALMILLVQILVLAPIQLARTGVVVDDRRGMVRAYFRGLAISVKNPFTILSFSMLFAIAAGGVFFLHHVFLEQGPLGAPWRPFSAVDVGVDPAIRPGTVAVLAGQGLVLLQQALVLLRASGYLVIYREKTEAPPEQDPELVYARPIVVDAPARRGAPRRSPPPFPASPSKKGGAA